MFTSKPLDKIADWLADYLSCRYPKASVITKPTIRQTVAKFITLNNLSRYFPERVLFQVSVDVCGVSFLESTNSVALAIVKFCNNAVTLNDCLTFKGYAQIVRADHAFIISPKGWTLSLQEFVRDFKRIDILEYAPGKLVVVAKWDLLSNSVRPGDVLLHGVF